MQRQARPLIALGLLFSALLLLTGTGDRASAQQEVPAWEQRGSPPANTWQMAVDPISPTILYALSPAGISRSGDGGVTWADCNREARTLRVVQPPSEGGQSFLYATTPGGLRASVDGCATWRDVPGSTIQPSPAHIRYIAPYPNNPLVLYAGLGGLGGLYRSVDGGANWQPASAGLPGGAWVTALTADPQEPTVVYAGVNYATRNHPPSHLFRSSDGGLTWRSASLGLNLLPNSGGVENLEWSGGVLYASTRQSGLFASRNRAASWQRVAMPSRTGVTPRRLGSATGRDESAPAAIGGFSVTPEGALLLLSSQGLYVSTDGAQSWTDVGLRGVPSGAQLIVSARDAYVFAPGWLAHSALPAFTVSQPTAALPTPTQAPPTPPPTADPNTPTPTFTPSPTPTNTPTPTLTPTLVPGPKPSDRVPPGDPAVSDYYEATGHNVRYGFRDWFRANGGVGFLGFPLTEEFTENGVPVQYFERGRLEYRDGQVSLARLAAELIQGQTFPKPRPFPSTDTNVFFDVTGYSVSGPFLTFWRNFGGLRTLGYPLSDSFLVPSGDEYQWFERARLEFHPSFPEGRRIVLGTIGTEALRQRGWIR
jgi:hypothetical protein